MFQPPRCTSQVPGAKRDSSSQTNSCNYTIEILTFFYMQFRLLYWVFLPLSQCPRYITFLFITHFCIEFSSIHPWPCLYFTANLNNPFSLHSTYISRIPDIISLHFHTRQYPETPSCKRPFLQYFNKYSFFTIAFILRVIFLPVYSLSHLQLTFYQDTKSAFCLFLYKTCVHSFILFYLSNINTLSFDSWIFRFMFFTTPHNISNICCKSFMLPGKIAASLAYRNTHLYLSQSTNLKQYYENSHKYIYKYILTSPLWQHTSLSYLLLNIFHISHASFIS